MFLAGPLPSMNLKTEDNTVLLCCLGHSGFSPESSALRGPHPLAFQIRMVNHFIISLMNSDSSKTVSVFPLL